VEEKRTRARQELAARRIPEVIVAGDERFLGRSLVLDLPKPLFSSGEEFQSVKIRQGINANILEILANDEFTESPITEIGASWLSHFGAMEIQSEGADAQLRIGKAFVADLRLLSVSERRIGAA
jgi:hypothetical protein